MSAQYSNHRSLADRLLDRKGTLSDARKVVRTDRGLLPFVSNQLDMTSEHLTNMLAQGQSLKATNSGKARHVPHMEDLDGLEKAFRSIPSRIFRKGANEDWSRSKTKLSRIFPTSHLDFNSTADQVVEMDMDGDIRVVTANETPFERAAGMDYRGGPTVDKDRVAKATYGDQWDQLVARPSPYIYDTSRYTNQQILHTPEDMDKSYDNVLLEQTSEANHVANMKLLRSNHRANPALSSSRITLQSMKADSILQYVQNGAGVDPNAVQGGKGRFGDLVSMHGFAGDDATGSVPVSPDLARGGQALETDALNLQSAVIPFNKKDPPTPPTHNAAPYMIVGAQIFEKDKPEKWYWHLWHKAKEFFTGTTEAATPQMQLLKSLLRHVWQDKGNVFKAIEQTSVDVWHSAEDGFNSLKRQYKGTVGFKSEWDANIAKIKNGDTDAGIDGIIDQFFDVVLPDIMMLYGGKELLQRLSSFAVARGFIDSGSMLAPRPPALRPVARPVEFPVARPVELPVARPVGEGGLGQGFEDIKNQEDLGEGKLEDNLQDGDQEMGGDNGHVMEEKYGELDDMPPLEDIPGVRQRRGGRGGGGGGRGGGDEIEAFIRQYDDFPTLQDMPPDPERMGERHQVSHSEETRLGFRQSHARRRGGGGGGGGGSKLKRNRSQRYVTFLEREEEGAGAKEVKRAKLPRPASAAEKSSGRMVVEGQEYKLDEAGEYVPPGQQAVSAAAAPLPPPQAVAAAEAEALTELKQPLTADEELNYTQREIEAKDREFNDLMKKMQDKNMPYIERRRFKFDAARSFGQLENLQAKEAALKKEIVHNLQRHKAGFKATVRQDVARGIRFVKEMQAMAEQAYQVADAYDKPFEPHNVNTTINMITHAESLAAAEPAFEMAQHLLESTRMVTDARDRLMKMVGLGDSWVKPKPITGKELMKEMSQKAFTGKEALQRYSKILGQLANMTKEQRANSAFKMLAHVNNDTARRLALLDSAAWMDELLQNM